jgi:cytochrome c553
MADIAQRLTDEDMEAVALYFSRLRPSSVITIDEQARGPGPQPAQN